MNRLSFFGTPTLATLLLTAAALSSLACADPRPVDADQEVDPEIVAASDRTPVKKPTTKSIRHAGNPVVSAADRVPELRGDPSQGKSSHAKDIAPVAKGPNLSSNRGGRMQAGVLQVVAFYDGKGAARLTLSCRQPSGRVEQLVVPEIKRSGQVKHEAQITTAQFELGTCELTSNVVVANVEPDGVIDGLAFGVFHRRADHRLCLYRTRALKPQKRGTFVGMWPLWLDQKSFNQQVPLVTDNNAKKQAQVTLFGAEYLSNGAYNLPLCPG